MLYPNVPLYSTLVNRRSCCYRGVKVSVSDDMVKVHPLFVICWTAFELCVPTYLTSTSSRVLLVFCLVFLRIKHKKMVSQPKAHLMMVPQQVQQHYRSQLPLAVTVMKQELALKAYLIEPAFEKDMTKKCRQWKDGSLWRLGSFQKGHMLLHQAQPQQPECSKQGTIISVVTFFVSCFPKSSSCF